MVVNLFGRVVKIEVVSAKSWIESYEYYDIYHTWTWYYLIPKLVRVVTVFGRVVKMDVF